MPNLVEYAQSELDRLPKEIVVPGQDAGNSVQCKMNEVIMEIVRAFSDEGHSGFSASYALSVLKRILAYKPVTPLTGEDDEWEEPYNSDGIWIQQNKRCSSVFRCAETGIAHDIDKYVFSDTGGETVFYTNRFRKHKDDTVTFPYMPPTEPTLIYIREDPDDRDAFHEVTDKAEIEKIAHAYRREREAVEKDALEAFTKFIGSDTAVME